MEQYKNQVVGCKWVNDPKQEEIIKLEAKVEELEKEWLEMNQKHEQAVKECFEINSENRKLQKRVDKAIRLLVKAELYQSEPNIDLAVKALKGEGQ